MKFELDKEQEKEVQKWMKKHKHGDTGAIGGQFTFRFTPTSIGTFVHVRCACKKELDVSHSEWF